MLSHTIPKVLVYVVAHGHLLVNWHCDFPDAGVQVPGGTIEDCEEPMDAARRELYEEAGLVVDTGAELIHRADYSPGLGTVVHDRHFVALQLAASTLQPFVHTVTAGEQDAGIRLAYFWVPLAVASAILGSGHAEGITYL